MALLDASTIRSRMRAVLLSNAGSARKIDEGEYQGSYWFDATDIQGRSKSVVNVRVDVPAFEVMTEHRFPLIGNRIQYRIQPAVVAEYSLKSPVDTDANRDAARAAAEQDSDQIARAMEFNMGGDDNTGIVSGSFLHEGSTIEVEDSENRRLVVRHQFTGLVQVTT